ncbi:MAG: hypothetical protein CMJ46_16075 [Planctomyces sp.]|nr:hypothetical protein [Planctomyces sp.]
MSARRIEILAKWSGFAYPPDHYGKLVLTPTTEGTWQSYDEISQETHAVQPGDVSHFLSVIDDIEATPQPHRFGLSAETLETHFSSRTRGDNRAILIDVEEDRRTRTLKSFSNHIFMLPWRYEGKETPPNYNPSLSIALAAILPLDWMFRRHLSNPLPDLKEYEGDGAKFIVSNAAAIPHQQTEDIRPIGGTGNTLSESIYLVLSMPREKLCSMSATELKEYVASGGDLSEFDSSGETALMHAAAPPFHEELFSNLLAAGADVNERRKDSETGLMIACAGGDAQAVACWLNAGGDPDMRTTLNATALMYGAPDAMIVRILLECGADPAAKDNDGDTALDYAMENMSIVHAGRRLAAIEMLAGQIVRLDLDSLRRSLERARELVRKVGIHQDIDCRLGSTPIPTAELRELVDTGGTKLDWLEYIDLEVTELELAERIVAVLERVLQDHEQAEEDRDRHSS